MSHCVAGVSPVEACGVVPLDVANSTTGFPRLLPLLHYMFGGNELQWGQGFCVAPLPPDKSLF